eukprot:759513-Hanusia_phi.AAC.6
MAGYRTVRVAITSYRESGPVGLAGRPGLWPGKFSRTIRCEYEKSSFEVLRFGRLYGKDTEWLKCYGSTWWLQSGVPASVDSGFDG